MSDGENSSGAVFVRLGGELYNRLEDFRRAQPKIPDRSQALRLLLLRALTAAQQDGGDLVIRHGRRHVA